MSYVKLGMHNTVSDALDCLDLLLILPLFCVGVVDFSMPNFFFNTAIEFKILAPPSGSLFMMRNCLLILSKVLSCLRSTLTSILSVTTSEISSSILWHGRWANRFVVVAFIVVIFRYTDGWLVWIWSCLMRLIVTYLDLLRSYWPLAASLH